MEPHSDRRTLALVGIANDQAAHFRMLLRQHASSLEQPWHWGEEKTADLLIVDLKSFAGQMARAQAAADGVPCAILCEGPGGGSGLVLRIPLRGGDLITMLNQVAGSAAETLAPAHADSPFEQPAETEPELPSFNEATPLLPAWPGEPPGMAPAHTPFSTAATASAGRQYPRAGAPGDSKAHPLRAYLEQDLLPGPVRLVLGDVPALVLDPKHKTAYSTPGLSGVVAYCSKPSRQSDWQPLTSAELLAVRNTQVALPYARLIWLDVLVNSGGQLAGHLDPGGTYRLTRWLTLDHHPARYFRIASSLLQPARLHEVAAASGAEMGDVFDFVNACDALDAIEWQPRSRRNTPPLPSLLDKLRRPFK